MNDPRKQEQDPADGIEEILAGEGVTDGDDVLEAGIPIPGPEPSAEELLTAERDELKEKWLRALAELDNLRKRSRREVVDARRFAHAEVLRPLLDIADNFERALQAMDGGEAESAESVRQGVAMIQQGLQSLLRERGVEAIEALGAEFDPALHEAVAQLPSEEHASGIVIDVVQQGYRFGEMVLRPARVVIAS